MHLRIFLMGLLSLHYTQVTAFRILFSSCQLPSYLIEMRALAQGFIARGHEVHIVLPNTTPHQSRLTQYGMKILTYKCPEDEVLFASDAYQEGLSNEVFFDEKSNIVKRATETSKMMLRDCHYMMQDTDFLRRVASLKFDFALASAVLVSPCSVILPHNLSIPYGTMSAALGLTWFTRAPNLPSFVPVIPTPNNWVKMSFLERIQNLFYHTVFFPGISTLCPGVSNTSLLEEFAPGLSRWVTLVEKSQLFIIPRDHHLYWPVPVLPNVLTVPGITPFPAKSLTGELGQLVDNAREGVIVMSFGTMAGQMPKNIAEKFMAAFTQVNLLVIWKANPKMQSYFPKTPKNVKLLSWLPQNDLLGHNNTQLFITHCGTNSLYEAMYHGVPVIGFPFCADQPYNSLLVEARSFGESMDVKSFTVEQLVNNIKKVMYNETYSASTKRTSAILHDQPMAARDTICHWIEHVIKYGGGHLRTQAFDLGWFQYFMLDILLFVCVVVFIALLCIFYVCRIFVRYILGTRKEKVY